MTELQRLRPRQFVTARDDLPVAYLGLGILEWHGLHNPLGLDGLKAHGVACHLAEQIGGIVMPPLNWGDNRNDICELVFDPAKSPWLPKGTIDHTVSISENLGISKAAFLRDAERSTQAGRWRLWEELVVHILFHIETLGFTMIIPIPGHYPLFSPLDKAIETYKREGGQSHVYVLKDPMFSEDGTAGDHAATFETSLMMALEPELVDITELSDDLSVPNIGVLGDDPRTGASPEFGSEILDKFESLVREEIQRSGVRASR